ncbi:DMT family transporter [Candidatus Bodocaedibacter vickermanii]|uniref:EamA/RhaT family transporter n=1 Tax=Candidatus Bodocaedibacter vickermanii TaxID=2741701 RepID=A0A7L9RSN3_9PROT|nr:EamA/RhaT family transporter [Candidatus Paracaedibacteraceae bacterium 'Lake Konstanz']
MTIPKDAKHVTHESISFAISYMLFAMFLFTTANTVVKYLGGLNPAPVQIVFFRNLIPLIGLILYFYVKHKKIPHIDRNVVKNFGLRSLFSTCGLSCLFYAYMHGNLSDVTAISFTSPLFISILAIPLLHEALTWQRIVGLCVGFGGVVVITNPSVNVDLWPGVCALLYACSAAYLMVTDRKLRHYYTGVEIVYYFSLGCVLISAVPMFLWWGWPSQIEWFALGIIGLLGGFAQLCIALAYRRARATLVAQTAYVSVVIAAIYNYFLFDTSPTVRLGIGVVMVGIGGIYVVLHERKQKVSE